MATQTTEMGDEARGFLQARVALFGKVMLLVNALGGCAHVATSFRDLLAPWFALYVVGTAGMAAGWLLCRTGKRSVAFSRGVEASMLVALTVVAAVMLRFKLPGLLPQVLANAVEPGDPGYDAFVGLFQSYMGFTLLTGLALTVVLRAAIVPSRVGRTVVLTLLAGVIGGVIVTVGAVPLEGGEPIRNHTPARFTTLTAVNFAIYWTLTTVICVAITRVVYDLRREVRRALQLGQYTLEKKLGEGGMGVVYRARHSMMRRPTAVKLLHPDKAGENNLARFEREVQLTSQLTHPNTITIFDYGRTPDGVFYYAMELLDGATLSDVVAVAGPLPPGRVLKVLAEVAGALEEAHGVDFIHRDIKPANILLCSQGGKPDVAKLVDFGLVKDLASGEDAELTSTTSITGTPLYMAPESFTSPEQVDGRGDIYALGAVGYFMLTGEHVFVGKSVVELGSHHLHTEPEPPSKRLGKDVPDDLEAVLLACLAKDPSERPQSASDLLERLRSCRSAGQWGDVDAQTWWHEHREALNALHPEEATTASATVAVDLARREAS